MKSKNRFGRIDSLCMFVCLSVCSRAALCLHRDVTTMLKDASVWEEMNYAPE